MHRIYFTFQGLFNFLDLKVDDLMEDETIDLNDEKDELPNKQDSIDLLDMTFKLPPLLPSVDLVEVCGMKNKEKHFWVHHFPNYTRNRSIGFHS